ncbi:hypothetical protein KSS87_021223, partial [Heliosperma pusillum]
MSQNNNIDIPLEIGQEEMERIFDVPHTQESQTFVASVRLPKISVVGKAIFLGFGCFTTKYLKMVIQTNVRKTLYVLVKFVLKRGSR